MLEAVDTPYFRDLQEQPAALSRTLAHLKRREVLTGVTRFLTQRFRRVVLTGMGSSSTPCTFRSSCCAPAGRAPS